MLQLFSLFDGKTNVMLILSLIILMTFIFVFILTQTEMMVDIKWNSDLLELKIDNRSSQ